MYFVQSSLCGWLLPAHEARRGEKLLAGMSGESAKDGPKHRPTLPLMDHLSN